MADTPNSMTRPNQKKYPGIPRTMCAVADLKHKSQNGIPIMLTTTLNIVRRIINNNPMPGSQDKPTTAHSAIAGSVAYVHVKSSFLKPFCDNINRLSRVYNLQAIGFIKWHRMFYGKTV
jgi:hypothetical protein